jgi:hypothetical protein
MTTVDDFAQGMLREYRTFAGQCAAIAAAPGAEETAAELYSMEDLPMIAARLRDFRARAEAAEAALVLACPHCGPEHFAGPDADGACVMCMGTLIRTDAAGAVLAHELYNGAHVAEAALATARAEGAAAERAAIVAALRGFAAAEDLVADEAEASENMGRGRINGGAIVRRGAAALRAAAGVIEGRRPVEGA